MPLLNIYGIMGNNIIIQLRLAFFLRKTQADYF